MVMLVKLLGMVIVGAVATFMIKPDIMKKYAAFWAEGKRIYGGAIISVVLGVMLLSAASECEVGIIVTLVGLLSIAKGVVLSLIGPEKLTSYMEALLKKPVKTRRLMMLISLSIGILLIYAA